jgi:hypothetical protein
MCPTWGRRVIHTGFLLEDLKEGDYLVGLGVSGRIILK